MTIKFAAMVELADTRDLKSLGVKSVPVQVWLAAPECTWFTTFPLRSFKSVKK